MRRLEFRLLLTSDYPALKPVFERLAYPLSPYSLSTLALWNECIYDTSLAVSDGVAWLSETLREDRAKKHLLLPVGGPPPAPAALKEAALASGFREYWYVPGTYVDAAGRAALERLFAVSEQPEYDDYVYRASDLADLPGRPYAKKRNLVRQFERAYVERGAVSVSAIDAAAAGRCAGCLEEWAAARGGGEFGEILECERLAITGALKNLEALELRGVMVEVEGRIQGFGIGSRLTSDTGVLNFEKASASVKGLYQYLDRECCRRLFPGMAFINKESDMGDPGLAKAKLSYHPALRVKSYRLELP